MNDLTYRLENIVSILNEILNTDFDTGRKMIYAARRQILKALTDIEKAQSKKCQCKCNCK